MADLPIACTLQPGELNARAARLLPGVATRARARTPVEGGYRFEFETTSEVLSAVVTALDAERQCCQFLRFQLTIEPSGGPTRLEVTGPPGSEAFLASLIDP